MRKELKLVAQTKRFIRQSSQLIVESERLIAEWQRLIDEQTAKMLKRISARSKRKRSGRVNVAALTLAGIAQLLC